MPRKADDNKTLLAKKRSLTVMLSRERNRTEALAASIQVKDDLLEAIISKLEVLEDEGLKEQVGELCGKAQEKIDAIERHRHAADRAAEAGGVGGPQEAGDDAGGRSGGQGQEAKAGDAGAQGGKA